MVPFHLPLGPWSRLRTELWDCRWRFWHPKTPVSHCWRTPYLLFTGYPVLSPPVPCTVNSSDCFAVALSTPKVRSCVFACCFCGSSIHSESPKSALSLEANAEAGQWIGLSAQINKLHIGGGKNLVKVSSLEMWSNSSAILLRPWYTKYVSLLRLSCGFVAD